MAFLKLSHIQKRFGGTIAVEDFNIDIQKGEFISFLGPSGCGKTTTLRMVAGFELPTSGMIEVNGEDISFKPPNQRNVGMVFQSYALFPNMTVGENIGFGLKVSRKPKEEIEKTVAEMLTLIHMPQFARRYPYQLSGGQQQRVALARALAIHPQVLLLDEPLSALDAKIRLELRTEIRSIQQKLGITTIYVTHDQEEALSLSDRVVVMKDGRVEQIGTPFEIYNFPTTPFVASFVGTLNLIGGTVKDRTNGIVTVEGTDISLACPVAQGNGSTVSLALRPEVLTLSESGTDSNRLGGRVQNVLFLGSIVRIQALVGQQALFFDMFNHPSLKLPAVGEPVEIYFPRSACLVMDRST